MHQIDEAQEAGYEESETVSSVIRAMISSLTLRNALESTALESTPNLLLNQLEAYFDERNAVDICSKLTSMVQLLEESEYQYVMRCIEIRQKVILASNKSDINYDKELVKKFSYHTLERGLLSSYVIQEIKSLIRSNASDEDLIAAVTKASAAEKERNLVQGKHHKKVLRMYEFSSTCNRSVQAEMSNKVDNSGSGKVDKRLSAVDALTKQSITSSLICGKSKRKTRVTSIVVEVNIYVDIVLIITRIIVTIVMNVGHQVIWHMDVNTIIEKLNVITGAAHPAVDNVKPKDNNCHNCSKILSDREYCCSSCKSVYFCGKNCQIQSWKDHKQMCKTISTLTAQRHEEVFNRGSYTVNLSTKQKHKVTRLIGEKCLIKILLNNKLSSILVDTSAQVSVISDKYVRERAYHMLMNTQLINYEMYQTP